jgi:hypothetical protein
MAHLWIVGLLAQTIFRKVRHFLQITPNFSDRYLFTRLVGKASRQSMAREDYLFRAFLL